MTGVSRKILGWIWIPLALLTILLASSTVVDWFLSGRFDDGLVVVAILVGGFGGAALLTGLELLRTARVWSFYVSGILSALLFLYFASYVLMVGIEFGVIMYLLAWCMLLLTVGMLLASVQSIRGRIQSR